VAQQDPESVVTFLPVEHATTDPVTLRQGLRKARLAVMAGPRLVVLGCLRPTAAQRNRIWVVPPEEPEPGYGPCLRCIRAFIHRPDAEQAERLWQSGALWATPLVVASTETLFRRLAQEFPALGKAIEAAIRGGPGARERGLPEAFCKLPAVELFAALRSRPSDFAALVWPDQVERNDLGAADREPAGSRLMSGPVSSDAPATASSSPWGVGMIAYLRLLSSRQRAWAAFGLVLVVLLVTAGLLRQPGDAPHDITDFSPAMSLKEIAPQLGVTGKSLARELSLPLDIPKGAPLAKFGVTAATLDHAVGHLLGHRDTNLKYWLYAALVVWGWIFLTKLGRPDLATDRKQKKLWYPRAVHVAALVVAVVVAGFLLGKSPNPMEGAVKVFKSMVGLYGDVFAKVLALVFFLGLAIVGNKLICGWGCPFGALQELVHSIPWLAKLKRRAKPSFLVLNLIRGGLFLLMLLLLFGWIGGRVGFVVYHSINPFNLFNLDFEGASVVLTIILSLLVGLVVYRPFCQIICPFGFLSWIAERLSLYRVRIDRDRCNECGACGIACPSDAADGIVKNSPLRADCFSCGKCLHACPSDAIRYEWVFNRAVTRLCSALHCPERAVRRPGPCPSPRP